MALLWELKTVGFALSWDTVLTITKDHWVRLFLLHSVFGIFFFHVFLVGDDQATHIYHILTVCPSVREVLGDRLAGKGLSKTLVWGRNELKNTGQQGNACQWFRWAGTRTGEEEKGGYLDWQASLSNCWCRPKRDSLKIFKKKYFKKNPLHGIIVISIRIIDLCFKMRKMATQRG